MPYGFGSGFFQDVLDQDTNPIAEFLDAILPKQRDPLDPQANQQFNASYVDPLQDITPSFFQAGPDPLAWGLNFNPLPTAPALPSLISSLQAAQQKKQQPETPVQSRIAQAQGATANAAAPGQSANTLPQGGDVSTPGSIFVLPEAQAAGGPFVSQIAQAQARAAQPASTTSTPDKGEALYTGAGVTTKEQTHAAPYLALINQVAQEEGIPAAVIAAIIDTEDSGPNSTSSAGAAGLMQVVQRLHAKPGENPYDPLTSIRQGARVLKGYFNGDWGAAAERYFGIGTDAGGMTNTRYRQIFQNNLSKYAEATPEPAPVQQMSNTESTPVQATPPPQGGVPGLKGLATYQYGNESLATGVADYICGPIAAQAFVRQQGRNPTLAEALDVARKTGVIKTYSSPGDPGGMRGIESTLALIRSLGGSATIGVADAKRMAGEIQAGRGVIVNTPGHYFFAEDYDPTTGKFDFGNSARSLRASGGNTWYTLDEIKNLGFGAPAGAIYAGY